MITNTKQKARPMSQPKLPSMAHMALCGLAGPTGSAPSPARVPSLAHTPALVSSTQAPV